MMPRSCLKCRGEEEPNLERDNKMSVGHFTFAEFVKSAVANRSASQERRAVLALWIGLLDSPQMINKA